MGEYVPRLVPGPASCATTSSRSRSPSPRASRSRSTATCCAGRTGRCASASTTARGWSCTRVGYDDGGRVRPSRTGCRSPRWSCPTATRRADHYRRTAFDIGEWGLGLHDARRSSSAATASARSATSTRCCTTRTGEPYTITQRDLHPRGGRRRPLEARRPRRGRRGAPHRAGSWSPSTSPSPTTSTSSTGASTRTATSSARCARPGSWSRRTFAEGEPAALRHARRRAHLRAVPPALPRRAARPRRRRRGQHRLRDRVRGAADRPGQPARPRRWCSATRRCAPSRRASRTTTGTPSAAGRWSTTSVTQRARHAGRLQARARRGASRPCSTRDSPVLRARRGDRPHAVGDAVPRRTSAGRAASSPNQQRRRPRPAGVDRRRPPDRGHRRRALVRVRHPPHHAPGGLAGHAGRHGLVLAEAVRLLRPQPGARRPPEKERCHGQHAH